APVLAAGEGRPVPARRRGRAPRRGRPAGRGRRAGPLSPVEPTELTYEVAAAGAADADDAVRVVLVTGAGRDFCVGADLSGGADTFSGRRVDDRPAGP